MKLIKCDMCGMVMFEGNNPPMIITEKDVIIKNIDLCPDCQSEIMEFVKERKKFYHKR